MTIDGDYGLPGSLGRVLRAVADERVAQDRRWGVQEGLTDGTGPQHGDEAERAKRETGEASREGRLTWRHVLVEEVLEAFAEEDPDRLRAELTQVAAVAVKWIQDIDRRAARDRFRAIVDVHVLLVRDGEVLMGRRSGTGYADGLWHLPSGHLEAGESATEAAAREAREEVGVRVDPADLVFAHVMHRAPERVGLFFVAERWAGEPYNAEPHKCSELGWFPLDRLPQDTVGYPAEALRGIGRGEAFGLYGF
ncbi:NUDIX domain-containing protein [Nonomuraea sp. NPDC049486]|uniref:NUDIX hydrolase n=1 Tax=unclassified Nonomuraea TaxID=2593643 RepID=UPI00342B7A66